MADTIDNRVAASALITFDLEKLYQIGSRQSIDLSQWLDQGLLLKEKEFRAQLKAHDWSIYSDKFIPYNVLLKLFYPWAYYWLRPLQPFAER